MKRYIRSDTEKNQIVKSSDDDDGYITFGGWCNSYKGRAAFDKFCKDLETEVRKNFDVLKYRWIKLQGHYKLEIYLNDGNDYEFRVDWLYLHGSLFEDGVNLSVDYYFDEIKEGIESGSALDGNLVLK